MVCFPLAAAAAGALLYFHNNRNDCVVADVCFSQQCWRDNPICLCAKELRYQQCMTDKGHKCWRLKPELVAANFLNNEFICDEYRCSSVKVCGAEVCCDKAYVVLSFPDCKKMAFELYQPVKKDCHGIWAVRRYAYV
ncbi:MAG: hypothetical protein E7588_07450 [Ruminococcaceae bacterium]|nr:hypothetical protein [Oscillospiraceae bacterium]